MALCDALADCSYVTSLGAGTYEWDDLFGPWLVRHGAWELWEFEGAPSEEVADALAGIPMEDQSRLSDRPFRHQPEFARMFFGHWRHGNWQGEQWFEAPSDACDLGLAAGVYAYFHGGDGA